MNELEMLERTETSFINIVRERLGYELSDMQKEVLRTDTHYARVCNRQVGKTTALLLKGILTSFQNPSCRVLFVSPNLYMLSSAEKEFDEIVTRLFLPSRPKIYFRLPYGLRGFNAGLILMDEKDIWREVYPIEHHLATDGKIISLYTKQAKYIPRDYEKERLIKRGYVK